MKLPMFITFFSVFFSEKRHFQDVTNIMV